jgi:ribosomal protein S18 acetylase RimI-like enzyme
MTTTPTTLLPLKIRAALPQDVIPVIRCNERNLPERYPLVFWNKFFTDYQDSFFVLVQDSELKDSDCKDSDAKDCGEDYPRVYGYVVSSTRLIISLAVDAEYRRCGYATKLLQTLLQSTAIQFPFTLTVRKSNQGAIALYTKMQFQDAGMLKAYYHEPPEDALLMELRCKPSEK